MALAQMVEAQKTVCSVVSVTGAWGGALIECECSAASRFCTPAFRVKHQRAGDAQSRAGRWRIMRGQSLIIWVIIGSIVGVLTTVVVKGSRFGLIGDTITGIIGAVVGGLLLSEVGFAIGLGFDPMVIDALAGSLVLLSFVRLVTRNDTSR